MPALTVRNQNLLETSKEHLLIKEAPRLNSFLFFFNFRNGTEIRSSGLSQICNSSASFLPALGLQECATFEGKDGARSLGAGIISSCEEPNLGTGNVNLAVRTASSLNR